MIELPNGLKSRTMPEQVGFNSKKIEEIIKFLNESGLNDLVITLEAGSGTLTPEQYAIAELSPSYIVLSGKVYYKGFEDSTNIDYFEAVPEAAAATSLFLQVARIRVVRDTRAYTLESVNLFESYNKQQIDDLLSAVNSALSGKADLNGAAFTGPITAPSIIEDMTGFSFVKTTKANLTLNYIYAGVVKNGNKITFAVNLEVTRTGTVTNDNFTIGTFNFPAAIGNQLFASSTIDLNNVLAAQKAYAANSYHQGVDVPIIVYKSSATQLYAILYSPNSKLTENTVFNLRFEQTFLLSDNLAE